MRAQLQNIKQHRNPNGLSDSLKHSSPPSTVAARVKPTRAPRPRQIDPLYVNPQPECSLINPDTRTRTHMQSLGLTPQESVSSDVISPPLPNQYDDVFDDMASEENLSPMGEAEIEDEDSDYDDILGQSELIPDDDDDDDDYDDVVYRISDQEMCDELM